ncbi:putative isoamyl alcohol protein [Phaeoacremonium minimum UCRPA7]|uniref:Putative isoamyl alcohol protein n=1 Tax=Phaeoacremonium minimum (strain UCR-PA7) TaxID=1286976 RepID=R8BNJ0_PHAM7|nr:putative isoamyl alcohol protein [Phaeoacremonium minimum UCRPA7]EOO00973.1 putative isoamyl alcohol protein [Phaeoacremonium minimum UCRPA7]
MDFPGGDISAIKTDTFEECLNSCDKTLGCIDVSYVAPSCYLKSSTATPVVAQNVWAAMAVESPAPTACAAGGIDLYPVRNEDVVATALSILDPAINATLNYAEKYPGTNAVSLYLNMLYPQVSLENSALLGTTCSNTSLTVTANSQTTLDYIMNHWPSSGLVFFTNTEACNTEKSRGIYLTTSAIATSGSLAIVFGVAQKNFTDVASDVTIKYGTITYDADDIAVDDPQYTSTCAETGTLTAAPTATTTSSSGSATVLDAGAQKFYDLLAAAVQYNDDGNIIGHPSNTQNVTVDVSPYDPTNTTEQAALEDLLEAMGLDSPESLASQASNGAKGVCYAPTKTSGASAVSRRSNSKNLSKRLSWDDITEYACDDTIDDLVGIVTDALGDACAVNNAVENAGALGCILKGGCYTTTTIITYYTPPPAMDYTFDYSWNVGFGPIQQDVVYGGAGKRVSCVNCGFSISNLEFSGEIVINMTSGIIKQADITTGISGVANMVAGLKSDGAWNGNWSYTYSTTNLGSISIDSAFNIV